MPITTAQAQTSIKNYNKEAFELVPSNVIYLFSVDISELLISQQTSLNNNTEVFRFHNHIKLGNTSIFYQGNEYIAAPISVEGFEYTSKGTLPQPRMAITVTDEAVPLLAIFKDALNKLGDLVGAKVTRIRTFAKFLDAKNFENNQAPRDFTPDPHAFHHDIFYIDRKSNENKFLLEFELASILDVEGVKLPNRLVLANRCPFSYRGEGCLYEYKDFRNDSIHGAADESTLPASAPPVANDKDELVVDVLGSDFSIKHRGKHDMNTVYNKADAVFIEKDGLKYHYVALIDNLGQRPPKSSVWFHDSCSKSINGCKLRFGLNGSVSAGGGIVKGHLRTGAFAAVNKVQ